MPASLNKLHKFFLHMDTLEHFQGLEVAGSHPVLFFSPEIRKILTLEVKLLTKEIIISGDCAVPYCMMRTGTENSSNQFY